jgi:hypothetical protein
MRNNLGYRGWFYFRTGWSIYFAFIISAINTLVLTYYLAIENISFLKEIFPSLTHYAITLIIVGIPILVIAGYIHFKRSDAFKSEADVGIESNPHLRRILLNSEVIIESEMKLNQMLLKLINNEKFSESEIEEIKKLSSQISEHLKNRTISDSTFKFDNS